MSRNNTKSYNIALCGVLSALSIMLMFCTEFLPAGTYVIPAFVGIVIWVISQQINRKWALLAFIAVAMLSFIVPSNIESMLLFLFFFGYYPTIRDILQRPKLKLIQILLKFAVFNVAVVITYFILINLLGLGDLIEDFAGFGEYALLFFWAIGNFTFVCYDVCFTSLQYFYERFLKPKIARRIRR